MAEGIRLSYYATPAYAEKNGMIIHKSNQIDEETARKIRNYYHSQAFAQNLITSVFIGALVTIATNNFKLAFQVTSGVAAGVITATTMKNYYSKIVNKFDMITNDNPKTCKMTYTYKRQGSNDGAYWITDIKLI